MFKFTTPPCDPPLAQVNRETAHRLVAVPLEDTNTYVGKTYGYRSAGRHSCVAVYRLPDVTSS